MWPEIVEWWRPPADEDKPKHFTPFLKHDCVVMTWTTGRDFPAASFLQRPYVTNTWHGGCGDRGSVRRACHSTMSSSQHDCNISWWWVYGCVQQVRGFSTRWLAAERSFTLRSHLSCLFLALQRWGTCSPRPPSSANRWPNPERSLATRWPGGRK